VAKSILEVIITAKDQASGTLKGLGDVLGGVGKFAGIAGGAVLGAGVAVGTGAFKMAQSAAPVEQVRKTFNNLANSINEDAGEMLSSLQAATRGMVSDAELMQASNRLMSMGLAGSTEEAAALAEMATQLGSAMGQEATPAMADFALMLANQSIPRLDNFGISSGKVRARIDELMAADSSLSREQAFMTATMEEGAIAMARIGEQSGTTQASMATMNAQMENMKVTIGTALLPMLASLVTSLTPVMDAMQPGLIEAAAALGAVFATDIIPVLGVLISSLLPSILELLPSITGLFSLLASTLVAALVPIIEVLVGVLVEIIDQLTPLLGALLPPLVELIGAVLGLVVALLPVITSILGLLIPIISTILPPLIELLTGVIEVVTNLVGWLVDKLQPAFDGIGKAVQSVMGWFDKMTSKLSNIKLPKWLTPGSPTPFELGLRGIADALQDVDSEIGGLTVNAAQPLLASGGAAAAGAPLQFQIVDRSTLSLSDSSDAERKLRPIVNRLVREAMAAR